MKTSPEPLLKPVVEPTRTKFMRPRIPGSGSVW